MRADYQRRLHQGRRYGVSEGCQVPDDLDCHRASGPLAESVRSAASLSERGSGGGWKREVGHRVQRLRQHLPADRGLHFDHGMVYTLRFFTHAEYSKDKWKDEL